MLLAPPVCPAVAIGLTACCDEHGSSGTTVGSQPSSPAVAPTSPATAAPSPGSTYSPTPQANTGAAAAPRHLPSSAADSGYLRAGSVPDAAFSSAIAHRDSPVLASRDAAARSPGGLCHCLTLQYQRSAIPVPANLLKSNGIQSRIQRRYPRAPRRPPAQCGGSTGSGRRLNSAASNYEEWRGGVPCHHFGRTYGSLTKAKM